MAWIWYVLALAALVGVFFVPSFWLEVACLIVSLVLTLVATMTLLAARQSAISHSR